MMSSFFSLSSAREKKTRRRRRRSSSSSDERTNEREKRRRHPEKPKSFLREEQDLFSKTNVSFSCIKKNSPLLFFLLLSLLGLYYDSVECVRGSSARKYDDALETG